MTEPDAGRPEASTNAEVTLVTQGITLTACVEASSVDELSVRPVGGPLREAAITPGDRVEVYWVSGFEERTLPAKVSSVEEGHVWRLVPTGDAERSQRRKAVRGKVEVPVAMPWAGGALKGATIDLSEGGMRALVDGWGLPPDPRAPLDVTISLGEDLALTVRGEVVWTSVRGTQQWVLAVRFTGLAERDEDLLRRRVFQALREERARELD